MSQEIGRRNRNGDYTVFEILRCLTGGSRRAASCRSDRTALPPREGNQRSRSFSTGNSISFAMAMPITNAPIRKIADRICHETPASRMRGNPQ